MYAIYGNMDPINIPPMLAYIPAPWILWVYMLLRSAHIKARLCRHQINQGLSMPEGIRHDHVREGSHAPSVHSCQFVQHIAKSSHI